jgi:hypothetical protein
MKYAIYSASLGILLSACGTSEQLGDAASQKADRPKPPQLETIRAGTTTRNPDLPGTVVLNDVRVAPNDAGGFDRIVFEFRGDRLPIHAISQVTPNSLSECGSGRAVGLNAASALDVRFQPSDAHAMEGESIRPTVQWREKRFNLPTIKHVVMTCDFEGVVTWAIGLGYNAAYKAQELNNPPRLVIDVMR